MSDDIQACNRSITCFLETVLDVCDKFALCKRTKTSKFYVCADAEGADLDPNTNLIVDGDLSVGLLFREVYKAMNRTPKNEIFLFKKDRGSGPECVDKIETKFKKITYEGLNPNHTKKLKSFRSKLKNSFLASEDVSALAKKLSTLIAMRNEVDKQTKKKKRASESTSAPFLDESMLERYTEAYYDVLLLLFLGRNVYSKQGFIMSRSQEDLLYLLLNLDRSEDGEYVSYIAPISLCNLKKVYDLISLYVEKSEIIGNNEALRYFYRYATIKQGVSLFRWYSTGNMVTMMQAAVQYGEGSICGNLSIPVSEFSEYGSYVRINEL